jgi:hypothetical protein
MRRFISAICALALLFVCGALMVRYYGSASTVGKASSAIALATQLRLGDPKNSDLDGPGSSIDNHPSGIVFYQREWRRGSLGIVEFLHGKHSFKVDNVLSVLGVDDRMLPDGIYQWEINFGVSPEQSDTHEAALSRMVRLLSDLKAKGWARYIGVNDPRLAGKDAWHYFSTNSEYSLDAAYVPKIDEWKAVVKEMPQWNFFADGVYLDVSLMESNMGGFVGKATYLISIKVRSEYAFYGLGFFPGDAEKIHHWKTLLPAELQKYHADRLKVEAALKAQGYTIDTTYQDPPIKALQESSKN